MERVLFVGPMLPATKRGLSASRSENSFATSRAIRAASRLISYAWSSRPNSDSPNRVAVNVLVVRMSAPASRYCRATSRTRLGWVSARTSIQPRRSWVYPANRSPRKSASDSSRDWSITPHEPSITSVRSASILSNSGVLSVGVVIFDPCVCCKSSLNCSEDSAAR